MAPNGMKKLAIVSSVHNSGDARVTYREGRALARHFDATLYLYENGDDSEVDAGDRRRLKIRRVGRPSSRLRRFLAGGRLLKIAAADRPDVVLVHDPELVPRLKRAGRRVGALTAYDAHEDYPAMMRSKPWIPTWLRGSVASAVNAAEMSFAPGVGMMVVADTYLVDRFGEHDPAPVLVRNYPPLDLFAAGPKASERPKVIAYVGGITAVRGSNAMIDAYRLVKQRVPDARLLLIGPVQDDSLPDLPPDVTMTGRLAYDEIGAHLADARAGFAIWADTPKNRHNIPSKIFDYMAAGVPFLTSDFPNIREACRSEGGLFYAPTDVEGMARDLERLLTDDAFADALQAQGLAAVRERYNFDAEGKRLVRALLEALGE